MIHVSPIPQKHVADCPPVPIQTPVTDVHLFAEHQFRHELLGSIAERLPILRRINAVEPDFLSSVIMHNGDRVTVRDTYDAGR